MKKRLDTDMSAQERLEQLGYKQELSRSLSVGGNVMMTTANASPIMVLFVLAIAPLTVTGTGTAPAALFQGALVILIGLILAELGSIYPVSGGTYSIVRYVLPKPLAFMGIASFVLISLVFPPSTALGVAVNVQLLFPEMPQTPIMTSIIAAVVLLLSLVIGLSSIVTSANLTKVLMVLQIVVLLIILGVFLLNPQRGFSDVVLKPQILSDDGKVETAGISVVLASIGMLFGAIGGYDAALGFSEETKGSCRNIAKAAIISAIAVVVSMVTPIILSMIAAPDLEAYMGATSPIFYVLESYMGVVGLKFINIGILITSFNATIMLIVWQARIIYAERLKCLKLWQIVLLALILIGISISVVYFLPENVPEAIKLKSSYSAIGLAWWQGILIRVGLLIVSSLWILLLINIMRNKKGFWSWIGMNTMPIYIFHLILVKVVGKYGITFGLVDIGNNEGLYMLMLFVLSLGITILLATKPANIAYSFCMDKSYELFICFKDKLLIPLCRSVEKLVEKPFE